MPRLRRTAGQPKLRKAVDESMTVRSKSGHTGLVREEVWINAADEVVKYNLAYIDFGLCQVDNLRVLGYDNAHGRHERHSMGKAYANAEVTAFDKIAERFYAEVEKLRRDL